MSLTEKYYEYVVDLIISRYDEEFKNAVPGHCIKITGIGQEQVNPLLQKIRTNYSNLDSFILSDKLQGSEYVSPTKLIELRNNEVKPILVVIPATNRTAAEDSFGNATFKDISLFGVEGELANILLQKSPIVVKNLIEEVLNYLGKTDTTARIQYLLAIESENWTRKAVGDFLFLLGLIPDSSLGQEESKTRARLNFNTISADKLSDFNRTIFERLKELPLEKNSIQRELIYFLKESNDVRSRKELVEKIHKNFPELNFSNWPIPDLSVKNVRLSVDELRSSEFKNIDSVKCLVTPNGKTGKFKVRVSTVPEIKTIRELAFFRVTLMASNGAAGEFVQELKKVKNSSSKLAYKDLNVVIDSNIISEGTYFIKVLAEDENGVVLNSDDLFKDDEVERHWQELKCKDQNAVKSSIERKLTCDSEDFYFTVSNEEEPEGESIRKDKLKNVFQSYFKFRIDQFKGGLEVTEPKAEEGTSRWIGNADESIKATFHIRYDSKHDYQINISSKLFQIEKTFLKYSNQLGKVVAVVSNNPTQIQLNSLKFSASDLLNQLAPLSLVQARKELFESISDSAPNKQGIIFTSTVNDFYNLAINYLDEFYAWTNALKEKFKNLEPQNTSETKELYDLLLELQSLDIVSLTTRLDDNKPLDVKLLSPLHPLRIAWLVSLIDLFNDWEVKTISNPKYKSEWFSNLNNLFLGELAPENNPLVLIDSESKRSFQYAGELAYGWGVYLLPNEDSTRANTLTSVNRQIKTLLSRILNIDNENRVDNEVSEKLIIRHLRNYILQHPYTDCLVINLFNAGDANAFANALVELESDRALGHLRYEIRLFKGEDNIIDHGEGLKNLLNPDFTVSEEAEAFSQPSLNRLFPKLRFSINSIKDFLVSPSDYGANLSFVISPFPSKTELYKPLGDQNSFFLNGLITSPAIEVTENGSEIQWNKFIYPNKSGQKRTDVAISIFKNVQTFIAGALASKYTDALPATSLLLKETDKVLINNIHDFSDWVVTFDKNLGPEIYDLPGNEGEIPFLLDFVPGEEVTGISSYLTTRPTSEIVGLLGPHFKEYDIPFDYAGENATLKMLLEDLRAVSSSLVMQLNSGKNKAFEVIGAAFTKRVLEKKKILENSFLIPIDLHQNLFDGLASESKSRADHLLVSIDIDNKKIDFTVIEVKCRKTLSGSEEEELKIKMREQIDNTILAFRTHFDPEYMLSGDRLDRPIKNKELKSLFEFYINRSLRYNQINSNTYHHYLNFIQKLDDGFTMGFKELGIIFDFSATRRHKKEEYNSSLTFFTFGSSLIKEILDPDSDLNTCRLEKVAEDDTFIDYFGSSKELSPFIQRFSFKKEEIISIVNYESNNDSKVDLEIKESKVSINNEKTPVEMQPQYPEYEIVIGKTSDSLQYGILGKTIQGKVIAIDANETNTISLFGVQGGGKSYTIGTMTEMMLKQFDNINKLPAPLSGVIFHYSETMDYSPEATSMIYPNDQEKEIALLKSKYGTVPNSLDDVIILTPSDKVDERKRQYPSIEVKKISFNSKDLNVQDWMFLLGAVGNDATYIRQLKAIMREIRNNITIDELRSRINNSALLTNAQRALAQQRLNFASQYIDDKFLLKDCLKPGRLLIVDLRDEFIEKDEALGLFVIMLNIFSGVKEVSGVSFNKFIVFDEAHKYMDNRDLTSTIVTAIREMRHKGVSIMIASQDPPSLPNEIIELSSVLILHKFNSPQWLKHIQKSITPVNELNAADLSSLAPGEAFLWATKSTDKHIMQRPIKIYTRPRVTKHGGGTIEAI
jgi:DNA phosphorothioation-dependent restriction protein DptH